MLKLSQIKLNNENSALIRRYITSWSETFEEDYKKLHVPVTSVQRVLLGIGSGFMAWLDPRRADMVAVFGETAGYSGIKYMHEYMKKDPEGSEILRLKPRINSYTIDLRKLSMLPEGTLGKTYYNWLQRNKVTPDSRDMVRYVDNIELAYVIQRYREIHDLSHTLLYMPTNMLGEVTVKWVEAFHTHLPLCLFGGWFGAVRLAPKQRKNYVKYYLPYAIRTGLNSKPFMNVYFERRWEQPMDDLLQELNVQPLVIPKQC